MDPKTLIEPSEAVACIEQQQKPRRSGERSDGKECHGKNEANKVEVSEPLLLQRGTL